MKNHNTEKHIDGMGQNQCNGHIDLYIIHEDTLMFQRQVDEIFGFQVILCYGHQ